MAGLTDIKLLVQVARQSHAVEQAEAERAELAHQAAELASEQAALQEQQKASEQEHDRLAALAAELASQQAAVTEQRSQIQEATNKAKVTPQFSKSRAGCLCLRAVLYSLPVMLLAELWQLRNALRVRVMVFAGGRGCPGTSGRAAR